MSGIAETEELMGEYRDWGFTIFIVLLFWRLETLKDKSERIEQSLHNLEERIARYYSEFTGKRP